MMPGRGGQRLCDLSDDRQRAYLGAGLRGGGMNLKQLRHFLAVVEEGTLNRASERLHLSQPAVSKSLQNLEAELGVALLERSHQGMKPTSFGRALVQHARLINAQVERAQREIKALKGLERGHLSFGVVPSLSLGIAPLAVARLLRRHPGVTVSMIDGFSESVAAALLNGRAEFIIAPQLDGLPLNEVESELLYVDRVVVASRAGHPLARRRKLSLRQLRDYPWVLSQRPDGFRNYVEGVFIGGGLQPPEPAFEVNSVIAMKLAVAASDALTFIPQPALGDGEGSLRELAGCPIMAERRMYIIRPSLSVLSPLAHALFTELKAVAADYRVIVNSKG